MQTTQPFKVYSTTSFATYHQNSNYMCRVMTPSALDVVVSESVSDSSPCGLMLPAEVAECKFSWKQLKELVNNRNVGRFYTTCKDETGTELKGLM